MQRYQLQGLPLDDASVLLDAHRDVISDDIMRLIDRLAAQRGRERSITGIIRSDDVQDVLYMCGLLRPNVVDHVDLDEL